MLEDAPEPDRADLREALATLPSPYREVIVLHYLADLPVDEVAAILEVPVGTVKSRLSRGRDALKGLLDDVEAPPLDAVRQRANRIRTNRRVAQTSAALAVVFASAIGFFALQVPPLPPVDNKPTPSPSVLTFSGSGILIRSVHEPASVPDLPGVIVELGVDGENILRTDADVYAKSEDGGEHWEILPGYTRRDLPPWGGPDLAGGAEEQILGLPPRDRARGVVGADRHGRRQDGLRLQRRPAQQRVLEDRAAGRPGRRGQRDRGRRQGDHDRRHEALFRHRDRLRGDERQPEHAVVRGEPILLPDGRLVVAAGAGEWFFTEDMGNSWTMAEPSLRKIG